MSNKTIVSLIRCNTYESKDLGVAIGDALDLLGGISSFVRPGDRVLLKPNLLSAHPPERRITTDPAVVLTMARLVKDAGGRPFIGDSPALDSLGVMPGLFGGFTKRFLVSKPVQGEDSCVGCGQCAQLCPAEAIEIESKKITFDYDQCIRCYCCQEICPEDAIHFHKGLLVRLLSRFNR